MLAMYSNLACDNWAELLPFVQLAHNTAYSKTLEETPHYLVFGRAATLPVELILGVLSTDAPQGQLDYSRRTVENLQLAYELARRNLKERADKLAVENEKLSFPCFKMGDRVLLHCPYHDTDGPNPKLVSPWHGPYTVRAKLSPVIYRVSKPNEPTELSVHLGRMKLPDFEALDDMFLGTTLPVPDLDGSMHTVTIGPYVIEAIDGHKRGVGAASVDNFQYHLKLQGQPTQCGVWRHYSSLPQCKEMIASYRAVVLSDNPSAFDPPGWKKRTQSTSARRRR